MLRGIELETFAREAAASPKLKPSDSGFILCSNFYMQDFSIGMNGKTNHPTYGIHKIRPERKLKILALLHLTLQPRAFRLIGLSL